MRAEFSLSFSNAALIGESENPCQSSLMSLILFLHLLLSDLSLWKVWCFVVGHLSSRFCPCNFVALERFRSVWVRAITHKFREEFISRQNFRIERPYSKDFRTSLNVRWCATSWRCRGYDARDVVNRHGFSRMIFHPCIGVAEKLGQYT